MGLDDLGRELLEILRHGDDDWTPLHMITTERLAYYRACEAELMALKAEPDKVAENCQSAE